MDATATDRNEALADFVDEALESLRELPAQLTAYRLTPAEAEPIHAVFRAVHSIKGCAAFLDLDAIRVFSHALENVLDGVRTGATVLNEELQRRLIEGFDQLDAMFQDVSAGRIARELSPEQKQILETVHAAAGAHPADGLPEQTFLRELLRLADQMAGGAADGQHWSQRLRSLAQIRHSEIASRQPSSTPNPTRPVFSDYCETRFACGEVDTTDRVTALLHFFADFAAGRSSQEAEQAFLRDMQDFADWTQRECHAELERALRLALADFRTVHESPLDFDADLVSLIWDHLWPALEKIKVNAPQEPSSPDQAEPSPDRRNGPTTRTEQDSSRARFVRVKEEHLDSFLDHVSRLFISSERLRDVQLRMAETGQLRDTVEELREINLDLKVQSTALQKGVMTLRRVSVAGLFSKVPRMARTLASQLGKQIDVHVVGKETEIDKRLSEDLEAPLVHLVRNVVDHGIELPDERRAHGKTETGNLYLEAKPTRSHVVICVRDDGRGMAPGDLRAKAVEKGVLAPAEAAALSDEESLQLIFRPGFSTAREVSEVSGRGVGMDVVRTALQQHGGRVYLESQVGRGTTIRMEVPIRQATLVMDGLMVTAGTNQFVIPFESIHEVAQVAASQFTSVQGRSVATIRNATYTAAHLGGLLGLSYAKNPARTEEIAVVVQHKGDRLCLRTDQIVGHRQVVVTEVKDALPNSTKLLGIAQLGGGRLAPVLNIPCILGSLRRSVPR